MEQQRNARCTVLEEVFGKLLSFLGLNRSCLRPCGTSVSLAWAQDSLEKGATRLEVNCLLCIVQNSFEENALVNYVISGATRAAAHAPDTKSDFNHRPRFFEFHTVGSTKGVSITFVIGDMGFYTSCDGEIDTIIKGSKFRESHILKILSWRAKEGGMSRPLVVFCQSLAHLTCFRYISYVTFAADCAVLPAVTIIFKSLTNPLQKNQILVAGANLAKIGVRGCRFLYSLPPG